MTQDITTKAKEQTKTRTDSALETLKGILTSLKFWIGFTLFASAGFLFGVAFGWLNLPDLSFPQILSVMMFMAGFIVFAIAGHIAIQFRRSTDYRFVSVMDEDGNRHDEIAIAPEAMTEWTFTWADDYDDVTPNQMPTRTAEGGYTVILARECDKDNKTVTLAGDLVEAPDDDQVIAAPETHLKSYRDTLLELALRWKRRAIEDATRQAKNEVETGLGISVDMQQASSRWGGVGVEEWMETETEDDDAEERASYDQMRARDPPQDDERESAGDSE